MVGRNVRWGGEIEENREFWRGEIWILVRDLIYLNILLKPP